MKTLNRKALNTIFYIYSDASVAVMMLIGFLIEVGCTLALPEFFHYLTIPAAAFFALTTVSLSVSVYRKAKKSGII